MSSLRQRVREAIKHLPPDGEGEMKMAKNTAKSTTNGKGNGAASKASNATSLADICKSCKIEPRAARRKLRNSDISVPGGRWEWTKAGDVAKVKKLLTTSAGDK